MNSYKIKKRTHNKTRRFIGGQYNGFIIYDDDIIPTNTITTSTEETDIDENIIDYDLDKIEYNKIVPIKESIKQITDVISSEDIDNLDTLNKLDKI
jgi:hypothetical protein